MKKQGYDDRLDERLGMRDGRESGKKQSMKDRRDESRGMRKGRKEVRDNMHAYEMYGVDSDAEKAGQKIDPYRSGKLGYAEAAWDYKY